MFDFIIIIAIILIVMFLMRMKQISSSQNVKTKKAEDIFIEQYQQNFTQPYKLINQYTFSDIHNGVMQIDHIILSPYGIFTIKNMAHSGLIEGDVKQRIWTQKNQQIHSKFQNPLHKNQKYIHALNDLLSDLIAPQCFHSLVIFSQASQFQTVMPPQVIQGHQWISTIQQYQTPLIEDKILEQILLRLEQNRLKILSKIDEE